MTLAQLTYVIRQTSERRKLSLSEGLASAEQRRKAKRKFIKRHLVR